MEKKTFRDQHDINFQHGYRQGWDQLLVATFLSTFQNGNQVLTRGLITMTTGLFTKERITFQKPFRNMIRTLSWFESLILPFVNAKLFQIRLLKLETHIWNAIFFFFSWSA